MFKEIKSSLKDRSQRGSSQIHGSLLIVMQTLHREHNNRLELDRLHSGMVQLVGNQFQKVTLIAPVLTDSNYITVQYPEKYSTVVLYRRNLRANVGQMLLKHLTSIPILFKYVWHADVVNVRLPAYPSMIAGLFAVLLSTPILLNIHGSPVEYFLVDRNWRLWSLPIRKLLAAFLREVTRLLSRKAKLSIIDSECLRRQFGGKDAVVIGHHQYGESDIYERSDTCLGYQTNLIYVGRLSFDKGTNLLLDAFASLLRENPVYTLTLVGEPWKFDIKEEIGRRGITEAVQLKGIISFGPQLFELYRASDILVFPSLHEGIPKVPMEALSQSLPVITTVAGSGGYIEHEVSGLIIPAQDPKTICDAVKRLVNDSALRKALIKRGHEIAKYNSRDVVQERIENFTKQSFVTK